ncbi:Transposase (putative), gypsy type [Quillaja saponaria]|uniref:Transposase (Putative), gypsy type n=1 Tax=Quillaja saponaria TaxID=32244 RepID=A0AAD7M346_QUISA|nr:Transposase (putative), gypsy type [Quillaja saponaria]
MSSEGDSLSAPPFNMSDGHPEDGTIVPMGDEPKYRPGKGNVIPPSLAYHPSTSSSSKNTEYGSFEDENEDTAMARFSPEQDGDEESDDDVAIFWPQTNITAVNAIENVISDQKLEIARRRYFEPMGAKIYKVGPYGDCPNHSRSNTLYFYEEYLKARVRYPFYLFIVKVLNALGICPAQITPNGWRFLITFIGICHTLQIRPSLTVFRHLHQIKNTSGGGYIFRPSSTCTEDNNKEWKPRYFFVEAPRPTDMGLTQEQEASVMRAATRRRLEALRDRAKKASSKGKRQTSHERMPPSPKSGRSQKRARAKPSSKEQTGPDSFLLAKVPAHVFLGILEGAYISDIPSTAYAIARGSTLPANAALIDDLLLESSFITGLSAGMQSFQYHESLYTKLKKAQEDVEYSTNKLLGTIQDNENLKARLMQVEKAEAEGRAASEHFDSLQAEVLCLGAEVEGWLEKCREQNEDADRLREEVERYRAFESEAVRLRGEKDEEIARLRAELEVSKEEAQIAVENFKNFDDCRKMIYDHGNRLYANWWVGCRVWLKEHNPSLDISEAKWPGEEEAEEEKRLAKMLAKAEANKEDRSEDEGTADEEVEAIQPDSGDQ